MGFESIGFGPVGWGEIRFELFGLLSELSSSWFGVPGADDLTSVTAEDPRSDAFTYFGWNVAFVFDGPITDASVCIEDIRGANSFCWTSLDAGLAGSAVGYCGGLLNRIPA